MDSTSFDLAPPPPATTVPFTVEKPIHPPYAEMIYKAIEALKEKDGSSKRAIGKYIEQVYKEVLPQEHTNLLTKHLNHLKSAGLLIMIKKSYKLPSSLPPPPTLTGSHHSQSHIPFRSKSKSVSNGLKRRPGRPPKSQSKPTVVPFPEFRSTRPRGRPKKYADALVPGSNSTVALPKGAKGVKKFGVEDLRMKLEHFQSKVKESLDVLKPYFDHQSPATTVAAIQELEMLSTLDLKAPLRDETHQFPPQQLPQSQIYEHQYLQMPLHQLFQPS